MDRKWFAAYTRSRQENRVAAQLQQRNLLFLLPTYEKFSRWSDRIHRLQNPLFPGYVFVHTNENERVQVLRTQGVVNIVSSGGKPCPLNEEEMQMLRTCGAHSSEVEPHPYLKVGRRVRILHGPFSGREGLLVEKKNSARVIVSLEHILQAVALNIHLADIEAIA